MSQEELERFEETGLKGARCRQGLGVLVFSLEWFLLGYVPALLSLIT